MALFLVPQSGSASVSLWDVWRGGSTRAGSCHCVRGPRLVQALAGRMTMKDYASLLFPARSRENNNTAKETELPQQACEVQNCFLMQT